MITVSFSNETEVPVAEAPLERVVSQVFLVHGVTEGGVGIWLVDEPRMRELNEQYKHHVGATDVLTFALHDPEQPTPHFVESADSSAEFGDIFLCVPVIAKDAQAAGESTEERLAFLTEHGCLHLLGIHHE